MTGHTLVSSAFFNESRAYKQLGLTVFLNAGDPSLAETEEMALCLDELGVDCLELAVPFPDSFTDGPVIRRSATRALEKGADFSAVLGLVARVRPRLTRMKIALLVDWSHSLRPLPLQESVHRIQATGADALLVHGLPPLFRDKLSDAAVEARLPLVGTCYATSKPDVLQQTARQAPAYVYLVAQYGRSGGTPSGDFSALRPVLQTLRDNGPSPIAVGFGVSARHHIEAVAAIGADAAIIGSAAVAAIEAGLQDGHPCVETLESFVRSELLPAPSIKCDEAQNSPPPLESQYNKI